RRSPARCEDIDADSRHGLRGTERRGRGVARRCRRGGQSARAREIPRRHGVRFLCCARLAALLGLAQLPRSVPACRDPLSPTRPVANDDGLKLDACQVNTASTGYGAALAGRNAGAAMAPATTITMEAPAITIRRAFASTAAWLPEVVTDDHGEARVPITFPD